MRIGIVGGGVVGSATAFAFKDRHEVRIWDILPERATHTVGEVITCDIVFLCLPTPSSSKLDTRLNLIHIERFISTQIPPGFTRPLVLKSTVPVGTTRALSERYNLPNLVHNPEFLTARTSRLDAILPPRILIGYSGIEDGAYRVGELYWERFPGVPIINYQSSDTTEMIKLALNSFFSVKVAFFNELREVSDAHNLDWTDVLGGVLGDGRIAHSHTQVPGPDGSYGFGGACLEKDANQFVHMAIDKGLFPLMTNAALTRNLSDRRKK